MDFRETPQEAQFRAELRSWLRENVRGRGQFLDQDERDTVALRFTVGHQWHRALARGRWLGLDWPTEHGGRGLGPTYQIILDEELDAADAVPVATWVGLELVGPVLLRFGTEHQKRRYTPEILNGNEVWCQAFSEPSAGSDLAAVRTVATPSRNGFTITGHKQWTSSAQFSDYALVLARTGDPALRHRSLSCFVVPLAAPGVTVRPIPMLYGDAEECDVLLSDVEVGPDALVGTLDEGWQVVMASLTLARGAATLTRIANLQRLFRRLVEENLVWPQGTAPSDTLSAPLALLHARLQALRFLAYRKVGELVGEGAPGPIASTEKLLWARLSTEVAELALETAGLEGLAEPDPRGRSTGWRRQFYRALANEIEGGTNDIQRTVIARHVLKLPC
jgi:alkylation response protein AidB-like acyl-CoA dehydrogenase